MMMNKRSWFKGLILASILCATGANAQIRYTSSIDPATKNLWSNNSNKMICSLIYDIPQYGYANFMTYSGKSLKTALMIYPKLGIGQSSTMRFIASKPDWHASSNEELLGKIALYPGFKPYVGPTLSWKILANLDRGNQIMMPYTDDKLAKGENIIPTLNHLGFKAAFKKYLSCQEQLLRVNFNDIKMMPLVFKLHKDELTAKSQKHFDEQLEYLKYDKSITKVTIRAYAYDMKQNADNIALAKDRAQVLKDAYLKIGIAEDVIEIVPFNSLTLNTKEENPIVDESVTARNALISLERDTALINKDLEVEVPDVGADSIE